MPYQKLRAFALNIVAQNLDFRSVILEHDEQLTNFFNEWMDRFRHDSDMTGPYFFGALVLRYGELTRL